MADLRFGAFLAPHHPIGEHPVLQFQSDLEFVEHLEHLGYDEFWCGEHHSTGWEMIASPELFLAAAAERTNRIMLGTGVVSLPYHHPFMVAQRMVQLDHQSRGRVIFGSGPGALPSDAHTMGIESRVLAPEKAIEQVMSRRGGRVVFVDDFVGSGNQFRETWRREYEAANRPPSGAVDSRRRSPADSATAAPTGMKSGSQTSTPAPQWSRI